MAASQRVKQRKESRCFNEHGIAGARQRANADVQPLEPTTGHQHVARPHDRAALCHALRDDLAQQRIAFGRVGFGSPLGIAKQDLTQTLVDPPARKDVATRIDGAKGFDFLVMPGGHDLVVEAVDRDRRIHQVGFGQWRVGKISQRLRSGRHKETCAGASLDDAFALEQRIAVVHRDHAEAGCLAQCANRWQLFLGLQRAGFNPLADVGHNLFVAPHARIRLY